MIFLHEFGDDPESAGFGGLHESPVWAEMNKEICAPAGYFATISFVERRQPPIFTAGPLAVVSPNPFDRAAPVPHHPIPNRRTLP
jgi:hypothetical protein